MNKEHVKAGVGYISMNRWVQAYSYFVNLYILKRNFDENYYISLGWID